MLRALYAVNCDSSYHHVGVATFLLFAFRLHWAHAFGVSVEVTPVHTKGERESFLRLPWRLYRDDPAWVPNLLMLQRDVISEKKNPFFDHGEAQLFLARREGEVVGRISAQVDRNHNAQHDERTGFFGFFECIDDGEVVEALLQTAES